MYSSGICDIALGKRDWQHGQRRCSIKINTQNDMKLCRMWFSIRKSNKLQKTEMRWQEKTKLPLEIQWEKDKAHKAHWMYGKCAHSSHNSKLYRSRWLLVDCESHYQARSFFLKAMRTSKRQCQEGSVYLESCSPQCLRWFNVQL